MRYQVSDHGAGRFSVQIFDSDGRLIEDRNIVRDINGFRVAGGYGTEPQFGTAREAAKHHFVCIRTEAELETSH